MQDSQVCKFTDDNLLFACGNENEEVIACIEFSIENAISQFLGKQRGVQTQLKIRQLYMLRYNICQKIQIKIA